MFERLFNRGLTTQPPRSTPTPLDQIAAIVQGGVGTVTREDSVVSFVTRAGPTHIRWRSVNYKTADGLEVSAVIDIRTVIAQELDGLTDEQISVVNTVASLGAMLRDSSSGNLVVASRLSAYAGDDAAWSLYVPLVAFAGILQADTLLRSSAQMLGAQVDKFDFPDGAGSSRWTATDFESTVTQLEKRKLLANGGAGGLTVEFPWERGAVSALAGHKTSLLTCQADEPHPMLGSGLFYKLELPVQFDQKSVAKIAGALNREELALVDGVPFFGAWCSQISTGRVAFVGFWPNFMYRQGTVSNIAVWMAHRSNWARRVIESQRR